MRAPARAGAEPDAVWIPGRSRPDLSADESGSVPESFWRAMGWFSASRLVVAGVLATLAYLSQSTPVLSFDDLSVFAPTSFGYVALAVVFLVLVRTLRTWFYPQLVVQVAFDLAVLITLVWAAGGVRSGLGVLMVATVAGAAAVSPPRLAAAFAAAATILLLGETALRMENLSQFDLAVLTNAGLLGTASFVTAIVVSWLAARLHTQEELARRRGEDLRNQLTVTYQVMAEIDRGIIVVGADGTVHAINHAAQTMLGTNAAPGWAEHRLRLEDLSTGAWHGLADAFTRARLSPAAQAMSEFDVESQGAGASVAAHRIGLRLLGGGDANHGDLVLVLEDLRIVEARAQQLKLASMGRLSASIAHEIRNPLAAIRHANGLLGETISLVSQTRLVRIIEDNTLRINRIIEDVLSISRRERAIEEPIEMREFLVRFLAEYNGQTGTEKERIVASVASQQYLYFDEHQLEQLLANLLGNALRYASQQVAAVRIEWCDAGDGRPELRVCDDGPGMSKDALAHAFEPFFTTESRGTGLGLYLARELCHANNATISYKAVDGDSRYRGAFVVSRPDSGERGVDSR